MDPILSAYRKLHPESRRRGSVAIIHSGGAQTIYSCVCGARHTAATRYRQAKHVAAFRAKHADCMRRLVEKEVHS